MGKVLNVAQKGKRKKIKHAKRAAVLAGDFETDQGLITSKHLLISMLLPSSVKAFMEELESTSSKVPTFSERFACNRLDSQHKEVFVDLEILKKRLSSYRTPKGRITRVPDELLVDILQAWEKWTGPGSGFYSALGADHRKMAGLIGRAKKLKREGFFPEESFKEIKIEGSPGGAALVRCQGIEIIWDNGKLIRFPQVELLIDFLKKVA